MLSLINFVLHNCQDIFRRNHILFGKSYINTAMLSSFNSSYGEVDILLNEVDGVINDFDVNEILLKNSKPSFIHTSINVHAVLKGILSTMLLNITTYYYVKNDIVNNSIALYS